jgi:omega-amidase
MNNLRVSLVQSSLFWEDIAQNLTELSSKIVGLKGKTDLIILPEMFTTGFSMNAALLAEGMDGSTMKWLKKMTGELACAITGSFIAKEEGGYFNRLVFMQPDGVYFTYDKRHLFTLAKEQHTYLQGRDRLIVEWEGWKICPLICYDLRFPVWSRNTENYDLLIYVANWPETRSLHWTSLLKARAIENQSFTIGVNRVGEDQKGFVYSGDSTLIDYSGTTIYSAKNTENIFTTVLSKSDQSSYRSKLDFLPDQDSFQIL